MGNDVEVGLMQLGPTKDGGARLILDESETDLVRRLTAEMRALITTERDDSDPVLDRLFPDAYEDRADEAAYRELIGDALVEDKLAALDTITSALGRKKTDITIARNDLGSWLASLTDLRLAIGTRLGVDEEKMAADINPEDPDARSLAVMHWLGWVQEGLLRTVL